MARRSGVIWKGPTFKKIFKEIEKANNKAVGKALRKSATHVKKRAQEEAPVLTGAFKNAIKVSVQKNRRSGDMFAKVGVKYGDPVFKYAPTVEKRTNLFATLEKTEAKPIFNLFMKSIKKTNKNLRIGK